MGLIVFNGPNGALREDWRIASGELPALRYLAITYPHLSIFDRLLPWDLSGLDERQTKLYHDAVAAMASFEANHSQSAIFALTPAGRPIALAAMRTIRGTARLPIARTIGEATSTIPTHRVLMGWRYPALAPLPAHATPESALAEFGRLSVATKEQLARLVAEGVLAADEADYLRAHGLDAVIGMSYARDQLQLDPPRAYIFNTKPLFARALRTKGLPVRPLFHAGAEPTPRMMQSTSFDAPYFQKWREELSRLLPPEVLAGDLALGIRELIARGNPRWERLPLNLPYLLLNDAETAAAMRAMAVDASRLPVELDAAA